MTLCRGPKIEPGTPPQGRLGPQELHRASESLGSCGVGPTPQRAPPCRDYRIPKNVATPEWVNAPPECYHSKGRYRGCSEYPDEISLIFS